MSTTARSVGELERITAGLTDAKIEDLKDTDREAWHFAIDPSTREALKKREHAEREAAKPKLKAAAAKVPVLHRVASIQDVFICVSTVLSNFEKVAVSDAGTVGSTPTARENWASLRNLRDAIRSMLKEATSHLADAERVSECMNRITELEARLAGYEKRAAAHDTAISAHRKHLSNLEIKHNDLKRAFAGEPPSGERLEK